jgi:hypothetical protein
MIEAGMNELIGFNVEFESEENAVIRIYYAMRTKGGKAL